MRILSCNLHICKAVRQCANEGGDSSRKPYRNPCYKSDRSEYAEKKKKIHNTLIILTLKDYLLTKKKFWFYLQKMLVSFFQTGQENCSFYLALLNIQSKRLTCLCNLKFIKEYIKEKYQK